MDGTIEFDEEVQTLHTILIFSGIGPVDASVNFGEKSCIWQQIPVFLNKQLEVIFPNLGLDEHIRLTVHFVQPRIKLEEGAQR